MSDNIVKLKIISDGTTKGTSIIGIDENNKEHIILTSLVEIVLDANKGIVIAKIAMPFVQMDLATTIIHRLGEK